MLVFEKEPAGCVFVELCLTNIRNQNTNMHVLLVICQEYVVE